MTVTERKLTGKHVLAITVTAFTVIIGANMALLYAAIGSFPGLEVKNSYVASQNFDADRAAQEALGWTVDAEYRDGWVIVSFEGEGGVPVTPAKVDGIVGRATHSHDDQTLAFGRGMTGYSAPARLEEGRWQVRLVAEAEDGTMFRQRLEVSVRAE